MHEYREPGKANPELKIQSNQMLVKNRVAGAEAFRKSACAARRF
jgi:hypothetical protein